ncbi:MAG: hypothetical protein J7M26_02075, partial [Armatimonadetes bacterium]|nr:hypothetical protein [Armatimonadota bacterium]
GRLGHLAQKRARRGQSARPPPPERLVDRATAVLARRPVHVRRGRGRVLPQQLRRAAPPPRLAGARVTMANEGDAMQVLIFVVLFLLWLLLQLVILPRLGVPT